MSTRTLYPYRVYKDGVYHSKYRTIKQALYTIRRLPRGELWDIYKLRREGWIKTTRESGKLVHTEDRRFKK